MFRAMSNIPLACHMRSWLLPLILTTSLPLSLPTSLPPYLSPSLPPYLSQSCPINLPPPYKAVMDARRQAVAALSEQLAAVVGAAPSTQSSQGSESEPLSGAGASASAAAARGAARRPVSPPRASPHKAVTARFTEWLLATGRAQQVRVLLIFAVWRFGGLAVSRCPSPFLRLYFFLSLNGTPHLVTVHAMLTFRGIS